MSGLPRRFEHASLDNFKPANNQLKQKIEMSNAVNQLIAWANSSSGGNYGNVLLTGPVGGGKTHLAIGAAKYFADKAGSGTMRYRTAFDLLADIKSTFSEGNKFESVIKSYCDSTLLIIDELDVGSNTDWSKDMLVRIFNYRYNELLPTIAISNLNEDDLAKYLDARIVSRLTDGMSVSIPCVWPAYRRTGKDTVAK